MDILTAKMNISKLSFFFVTVTFLSFLSTRHSFNSLTKIRLPNLIKLANAGSGLDTASTKASDDLSLKPTSDFKYPKFSSPENSEIMRKWFLLNYQKRAEISHSTAETTDEIISDIFKSLLISFQVLNNVDESKTFSQLQVFPNVPSAPADHFKKIESIINELIQSYKVLFQPDFDYNIIFLLNNPASTTATLPLNLSLVVLTDTVNTKKEFTAFYDIENLLPKHSDDLPNFEDTVTNQIPNFPFPSIYDFISEINRPLDPFTLANLKFKFTPLDLKFNLEQMKKKKKNPQDYVDMINAHLTRLQKWRDVLTTTTYSDRDGNEGNMGYDMFTDTYEWGEQLKRKYASMIVQARTDPKYAMDNQYNKRKVFIKIIDEWSVRLKQSFKFIYESKRSPPQDFLAPILASRWRKEVISLTQLPAKVAFLDLGGPVFIPGQPKALFNESRRYLWEKDYPVPLALFETLVWVNYIERVKARAALTSPTGNEDVAGLTSFFSSFGDVTQHTYSRGELTERVLYDCYSGLSKWTRGLSAAAASVRASEVISVPSSSALLKELVSRSSSQLSQMRIVDQQQQSVDGDHTDSFKNALLKLNRESRQQSVDRACSVKEMYKQDFGAGRELTEWWTTMVRDLDLVEIMERVAAGGDVKELDGDGSVSAAADGESSGSYSARARIQSTGLVPQAAVAVPLGWSAVVERVVSSSLRENEANAAGSKDDDIESKESLNYANRNTELWNNKYKAVLQQNEVLSSVLPWRSTSGSSGSSLGSMTDSSVSPLDLDREDAALSWLLSALGGRTSVTEDVVHVQFDESKGVSEYASFLFVTPRFFRGVGLALELNAFLEFAKMIKSLLTVMPAAGGETSTSQVLPLSEEALSHVEIVPLHPNMVTREGFPDFTRRSPHPCLLFRIPKKYL